MTRWGFCAVMTLFVLVLLGASAANAQDADKEGWSIRFNATWTIPDRTTIDDSSPLVQIETNTSAAFGGALSGEYRFSDGLGLEVGVQAGYKADVTFKLTDPVGGAEFGDPLDPHPSDGLRFTIADAALNIYLSSGEVDFYIGPVIGYITYSDMNVLFGKLLTPGKIQVDGDYAIGGVLGLDIQLPNSDWFFTSSLKYMESSYDAKVGVGPDVMEVDFDPLIIRAGFGYRF